MDQMKTGSGKRFRSPALTPTPLPIPYDPAAMPGATVLGSDGALYRSSRITPSEPFTWNNLANVASRQVVLHVSDPGSSPLTGNASIPAGLSTTDNLGYLGPTAGGLQGRLFPSITAALSALRTLVIPPGTEIIVSLHNNIVAPEVGPLIVGNGQIQWVIAGARGATTPKFIYRRGTTTPASAFITFGGEQEFCLGGSVIIDCEVELDLNGASTGVISATYNGGYGTTSRDTIIRWRNFTGDLTLNNSAGSERGTVQYRFAQPGGQAGLITNVRTIIQDAPSATACRLNVMGPAVSLTDGLSNLVFLFASPLYGTLPAFSRIVFNFDHTLPITVAFSFLNFGSSGGSRFASRTNPVVDFNFNAKNWNLSEFIGGEWRANPNLGCEAFRVAPVPGGGTILTHFGVNVATAGTLATRNLTNGCCQNVGDNTLMFGGPLSFLAACEGQVLTPVTVPTPLFRAERVLGSYVWGAGTSARNI